MRYALDLMVKKGFVTLSVPTLVRSEIMVGTGYFPGGAEQAYRTAAVSYTPLTPPTNYSG